MLVTTNQILELFVKIQKLGATYDFMRKDDQNGYVIRIYYTWEPKNYYYQCVFISDSGESNWDNCGSYFTFDFMNELIDDKIEEREEVDRKYRQREKLIKSLTPEQRELLGV